MCIAISIHDCDAKNFFFLTLFERQWTLAFTARAIPSPEVGRRDTTDAGRDWEACLSFEGELHDGEEVKVVELPAVETMASVIYHGSFSTLNQAYNAILTWIEANSYHISGPNRELNLEYEPGGDESKFVTEAQFPVEKR